ncbi:MAG: thymidine phosphorylase [Deltaproteobacteria bacterium]|nr:thymidine phosphorylase [Deltaproteobacteria bacterium]
MLMAETIRFKRDGGSLAADAIRTLIRAYSAGEIPDYQMAALLMAVYFRGLDDAELAAWASAMLHSGEVVDLASVPGAKVDKHSTGGVGDKISIPLAPLVAACGVRVPMISGRGLGHTGGTLDKLESIPGFRTDLSVERFVRGVAEVGTCMIGQTEALVPADRRMYALRDVTGTVESIPLISASIMSKKLAEGISGLVLDVKVGSGAFMKTPERARELARTMVGIGNRNGVRTVAFLTDMSQPVGWAVGNALEIAESVEVLRGCGPADTTALVESLGGAMLVLGGVAATLADGEARIREAIRSGAGLDRFRAMVSFQGGDPRVADDPSLLPAAASRRDVPAPSAGWVTSVDCERVGIAALVIGGGRRRKEDSIAPAVGLRIRARIGARVDAGQPLATIEFNDPAHVEHAAALVAAAYGIGPEPPATGPLVLETIGL